MANYDGANYTVTTGEGPTTPETYKLLYWTSQPTWGEAPNFGPGGSGGGTPSGQDLNGYGYSHSG